MSSCGGRRKREREGNGCLAGEAARSAEARSSKPTDPATRRHLSAWSLLRHSLDVGKEAPRHSPDLPMPPRHCRPLNARPSAAATCDHLAPLAVWREREKQRRVEGELRSRWRARRRRRRVEGEGRSRQRGRGAESAERERGERRSG